MTRKREEEIGVVGRISGFRIGALSEHLLPIVVMPGDTVSVTKARFTWTGPARWLALGWGIKLAGNFDYGAHLIDNPRMWAWGWIQVPEGVNLTDTWNIGPATMTIPTPGDFRDRLNAPRVLHWGGFDTWSWVLDGQAALDDNGGDPNLPDQFITSAEYVFPGAVDVDDNPIHISTPNIVAGPLDVLYS